MLPNAIVVMEDHDKAYYAWKEHHVCARTLVHVDAHIDFGWVPEIDFGEIGADSRSFSGLSRGRLLLNPFLKSRVKMVNIGNYICPAIREGMVNKFYWVVPDESWASGRGKKHIMKQLQQLLKIKTYSGGKIEQHKDHIRCRIMKTDLIVCSLGNLERIEESVLLDIDVDFMLTKHIWDDLNPERFPWIFPEELYEKIGSKISNIDVLTIAYSVEGGFTPLKFKYLGVELQSLFKGDKPKTADHKRKALVFEREKKIADACAAYEAALKVDDTDASIYYNLALLHLYGASGTAEKAADCYHEAVARDRSYTTSYNNYGILYLQYNKRRNAEIEYKRFQRIDGNNASVLNGLGCIALAQRRYAKALKFFDLCLAVDNNSPAARSGKATVSFKKGGLAEAEQLFLGLKRDHPDDAEVYWWLGRIAQKRGEVSAAIENYKDSVMRGGEGPLVHLLLASLYMRKRLYYRVFEELKRSLSVLRISF
jgi:Tfp pilus assembly protein PilF